MFQRRETKLHEKVNSKSRRLKSCGKYETIAMMLDGGHDTW